MRGSDGIRCCITRGGSITGFGFGAGFARITGCGFGSVASRTNLAASTASRDS